MLNKDARNEVDAGPSEIRVRADGALHAQELLKPKPKKHPKTQPKDTKY